MNSYLPRARHADLIVQSVHDEIMIYDQVNDSANVLNKTAAFVWRHCDGQTKIPALAAQLSHALGAKVDEALVWHTLDLLSKKGLLAERPELPTPFRQMKRRDFLRAGVIGAAVLLPVIISLTAPEVAHAQSGCLPFGTQCNFISPELCCSMACSIDGCPGPTPCCQ